MSIASVVTRGYGAPGSVSLVLTDGYAIGAVVALTVNIASGHSLTVRADDRALHIHPDDRSLTIRADRRDVTVH